MDIICAFRYPGPCQKLGSKWTFDGAVGDCFPAITHRTPVLHSQEMTKATGCVLDCRC